MKEELRRVANLVNRAIKSRGKAGSDASDLVLLRTCLLELVTFQLPAESARDRWIGFREFFRTTRKIFSAREAARRMNDGEGTAILGGYMPYDVLITRYIEFESAEKVNWYIAKAEWPCGMEGKKFSYWLSWARYAFPLALKCIFDQRRTNLGLLVRELHDTAILMHWLKSHQIRVLYDFLPYELDSNLISLLCREDGINVVKIPSSGPLSTHNKIMIGEEIVFSSPYHEEEYALLKGTIRCNHIRRWGPEKAYTYIDKYRFHRPAANSGTIGFYSHGSWLRIESDHADVGLNIPEAEELLLKDLARLSSARPDLRIKVFLHPRERHESVMERTRAYYQERLGSAVEFSDAGVPTAHSFADAEIAVAAFSTILFERLFCGYKTLIGKYNIPGFPIEGSNLNHICFSDFDQLMVHINQILAMTDDEFFVKKGLNAYRWDQYPAYRN